MCPVNMKYLPHYDPMQYQSFSIYALISQLTNYR
jgi:hypothetical protein